MTTATSDEAVASSGVNRRRLIPVLLLALGIAAYGGSRLWQSYQPYEWSGTVEAKTISVGSRTGGRVSEVLVREGDHVNAGQTLVVLDARDLYAQKSIAEGELAQAEAGLQQLESGARPEEIAAARARAVAAGAQLAELQKGARSEQIAAARARADAAGVAADKADLDAKRAHELFAKGAASQSDVDNADAQLKTALLQRDALVEQLRELTAGSRVEDVAQARARAHEANANAKLVESGARSEEIQAARGVVEAARGRLAQVNATIDELTVKATRPARVESLDLRPGDILAPNATAAVLLEDGQLYVRIYVPETQIGHVSVGQRVPIFVDSFPDRQFHGKVEHINQVGEYSPRNLQTADERAYQVFATRVALSDGLDALRAGMAAFVKVAR